MKKLFFTWGFTRKNSGYNQILRIMRLTTCFLFLFTWFAFAESANSQNARVSLNKHQAQLQDVLDEIEKQTDYLFISNRNIDLKQHVSVQAKNKPVREVLNTLFAKTDLSFTMEGVNIILIQNGRVNEMATAPQQARSLTGVVTDQNGEPVIGANVVEKGTTNGTITDIDGKFMIDVAPGATLLVSYIGYTPSEIKVGNKNSLAITLHEDTELLDEVVVVGYGTVKKGNLTTAVSTVKAENLVNRPVQTMAEALQGEVPGLNIVSSGRPGQAATMQLRGATSLNETGSPLVLIDGVPGEFNYLNVDDVESVTVLKDAASAAIYGSRAAHGVILVTTKRGKSGKPTFVYNGSVGVNTPTNMPVVVGASEYARIKNEAYNNIDKGDVYSADEIRMFAEGTDLNRYPNTNWLDLMFQNSIVTRHSIAASGGTDNVKYHLSGGFDRQTGVVPEVSQNIFNVRSNVDIAITKKFGVSFDFRYIQRKKDEVNGLDGIVEDIYKMDPTQVAYYTDGTYGYNPGLITNPIAYLHEYGHNYQDKHDASGIFKVNYDIFEGLKFTGIANVNYQFDNISNQGRVLQLTEYFTQQIYEKGENTLMETRNSKQYYNLQALLNYKKSFGKHNLEALVGFQSESERIDKLKAGRKGYPTDLIYVLDAGSKEQWSNEGTAEHWRIASALGRLNYDYDNKYMVTASFRSDGSSRFASGHRWSTFPSVSAAWRVTEESFMENAKTVLDDLKIRGTWGITGASSGIGLYPSYTTIDMGGVVLNNVYTQTALLKTLGNTDLGWEKTAMFDIGIDAQLLGSRLSVTADYYQKKTSDILLEMPVPMEYGFGKPKMNIGEVMNKGWEVAIGWNDNIRDFQYSIQANLSDNKNEVTDLGGSVPWIKGKGIENNIKYVYDRYTAVGYPMNSIYGYESMGLFQSQEEIDNAPFQNLKNKPGDVRYKNQNDDEKIDGNDRVVIGDPNPHYLYGLRLSGQYKGFDLSMFFQGVGKRDFIATGPMVRPFHGSPVLENHLDYWSESNKNAAYPRVLPNAEGGFNYDTSDYWKMNAGYLRMKNLQFGYTLPKSILNTSSFQRIRLYFSATNLFTIDNFSPGYDPETGDAFTYPLARTYSFGLNVQF